MENENLEILTVPVLPLRGLVVFPGSILHFDVSRKKSVNALMSAMEKYNQKILIAVQKHSLKDEPETDDFYSMGVLARILQIVKVSDNVLRVVVKGIHRAEVVQYRDGKKYLTAQVVQAAIQYAPKSKDTEARVNVLKEMFNDFSVINGHVPQDMYLTVYEMTDPGKIADYIADNIIRDYHKKQEILSLTNEEERIDKVIEMLGYENELLSIEETVTEKAKLAIEMNQRDYYIRERIKAMRSELGEDDDLEDTGKYTKAIEELKASDEVKAELRKEVSKLEKMMPSSPEYGVSRTYLDTCLALPWGIYTKEKIDIKRIAAHLDKNHYGLKKVKESIVEALAVRKLNPDINGQIICLVGPPGVGKTSIAKGIAEATGRNYQRIALGGVHDEAEIRGHRRTYIGAMMGRIMNAMKQAKSSNPLILLDEVDKLGESSFNGDPASALLEVLDGEQNSTFYDHYVDLPFDLSKVMFITTANDPGGIPAPLLDRMDIIYLDSYTREEKYQIAKLHLITKQLKRHGLNARQFKLSDEALYDIIDSYTREAGVRLLEKTISRVMNKAAVKIVSGETKSVKIGKEQLEEYLGSRKYKQDDINHNDEVGVVTGLAWTAVGGETMPIEVAVMTGSGKIELTGSLGDVMKESAQAAYTCIRTMANELHIDSDFYKNKDIHIHVPEGAVPKDGPSAGITMATAITSALTGIPVRHDIAMTGEITIRGRVLPIGGLKEKAMAAYRLGIKTIVIPENNKSDLDEVDDVIKESIQFILANNIHTVLDTALVTPAFPTE